MFSALSFGGVLSGSGLFLAAAETTSGGGINYTGIAALIASFTGLFSAVAGLVLALRKQKGDLTAEEIQTILETANGHKKTPKAKS